MYLCGACMSVVVLFFFKCPTLIALLKARVMIYTGEGISFSRGFERWYRFPRGQEKDCLEAVWVNINLSSMGFIRQVDKRNNLKRQIHTMLLNPICDFYDQVLYLQSLPCSTLEILQRMTGYDFHVFLLWRKSNFIVVWIFLYTSFMHELPSPENCGFPTVPGC